MMKKNILLLLITCFALSVYSQDNVKSVLNKTDQAFRNAGGIEANFTLNVYSDNILKGEAEGVLKLDEKKFYLQSPERSVWFDGITQWTYLADSDEVNIATPTEEELQEINPYAILGTQSKDYKYSLGKTKQYKGKPVTELVLTAAKKDQNIRKITAFLDRSYMPVYIVAEMQDGMRNEITVTSNKLKQNFGSDIFIFDKNKYPTAEIIDLR